MNERAIAIEEYSKCGKEYVHIDGYEDRYEKHGQRAHEHIHVFVSNDSKGCWIEEYVVRAVELPHENELMAQVVVKPFVEITCNPQSKKRGNIIGVAALGVTEGLRVACL